MRQQLSGFRHLAHALPIRPEEANAARRDVGLGPADERAQTRGKGTIAMDAKQVVMACAGMLMGLGTVVGSHAEGTETLGPPLRPIEQGSSVIVTGVGMNPQPVMLNVEVPADAAVKQAWLYWLGESLAGTHPDATIVVNGVEVVGDLLGGNTPFFSVIESHSFRADISDFIMPGPNALELGGLRNSWRNVGAGLWIVYDDEETTSETHVADGIDIAYALLAPPRDMAVPVTFSVTPADVEREATAAFMAGGSGENRPHLVSVTTGGTANEFINLFTAATGRSWDVATVDVVVPANADTVTLNVASISDGTTNDPAALEWIMAGLNVVDPAIPKPEPECGPCEGKITELTLRYNGQGEAWVEVVQRVQGPKRFDTTFAGVVHPGDEFSFLGLNKQGNLGPHIWVKVNGYVHALFNTTCDQPIGPGSVQGDFEIVAGFSAEGGPLCEVTEQQNGRGPRLPQMNGKPDRNDDRKNPPGKNKQMPKKKGRR